MLLKAENVKYIYSTAYRKVEALRGVSCEFEEGCFYAVVGPSGSGKTTLMTLLAGLDVPTEGDVFFDGKSSKELDLDKYRRSSCSVIYQSFNLFPLLSALENVMYPMLLSKLPKKEAEERAKELILSVGLPESVFKQYPKMMSGGEQQRVAIARALSSKASLILADEPTGNLDTDNSRNVVEILKNLAHEQNKCVIVITHDKNIAAMADKIYEIKDGLSS